MPWEKEIYVNMLVAFLKEEERRMKEQQAMGGGGFYGAFPETYNVVVNANHEKISDVLNTKTKKMIRYMTLKLI